MTQRPSSASSASTSGPDCPLKPSRPAGREGLVVLLESTGSKGRLIVLGEQQEKEDHPAFVPRSCFKGVLDLLSRREAACVHVPRQSRPAVGEDGSSRARRNLRRAAGHCRACAQAAHVRGPAGGLDYQKKTVEELGVNYRVQSSGAGPLAVPEDVAPLPGALSMCPCTLTSTCLILRTFTRPTSPTLSSRATARAAGAGASPRLKTSSRPLPPRAVSRG